MKYAGRTTRTSLVDILDRVLDKGIVIDATVRVSLIGIDLLGVDAQITVASFQTYLQLYDDPRAYQLGLVPREPPRLVGRPLEEPSEAGPSLGGVVPTGDPEELGRAAFREERPEDGAV